MGAFSDLFNRSETTRKIEYLRLTINREKKFGIFFNDADIF